MQDITKINSLYISPFPQIIRHAFIVVTFISFALSIRPSYSAPQSLNAADSNTSRSEDQPPSPSDTETSASRSDREPDAAKAVEAGNSETTAAVLRQRLDEEPADDDARVQLARILGRTGEYKEARSLTDQVLARTPDHADALLIRGFIELWSQNQEKSRPYFQKVIQQVPDYCDAYVGLASSYVQKGNREEGRRILDSAADNCTTYPELMEIRFRLEVAPTSGTTRQKSAVEDRKVMSKLADTAPRGDMPSAHKARKESARGAAGPKQFAGGSQGASFVPMDIDATVVTARQNLRAGNIAQADQQITAVLDVAPRNSDALVIKAMILVRYGYPDQAGQMLDGVLASEPANTDALVQRGVVSMRLRQYENAIAYYQQAARLAPDYCDAWYGLSDAYLGLKNVDFARQSLANAPQCATTAEGIAQTAQIEYSEGNYAYAKTLYAQALSMQPHNQDILDDYRMLNLYDNIFTVEYESFEKSGNQTIFTNVTGYRPCRTLAYRAIAERFHRSNGVAHRAGLGVNWEFTKNLWLDAQALKSFDEKIVTSRYETDLTWKALENPGTFLTLGGKYYDAFDDSARGLKLAVDQALDDRWTIGYESQWTSPASAPDTQTNIVKLTYFDEQVRRVSLVYAQGGESFSENSGRLAATGEYDIKSIGGVWKEWIRKDCGFMLSAGKTSRTNGNDSKRIGGGLFFEF